MAQIARIGDQSDHGGEIVSGCTSVFVEGKLAARVGDSHSCPRYYAPFYPHGTTAITSGSQDIYIEGKLAALVGVSKTGCGATITSGSTTVLGDS